MGIKALSQFLRKNYPELFETVSISEYAYKKIAVDVSLYMYYFVRSHPIIPEKPWTEFSWLGAFFRLVSACREHHVHATFIYDSKHPAEKEPEKEKRRENHKKLEERVLTVEMALENYENTGEVDNILLNFQKRRKIESLKSLIHGKETINVKAIQAALNKSKNQLVAITPEHFALSRQLFDILDVPYFTAPMESETMCADLCIQGQVDAVLSEDTDVLAYGAPVFLTKIDYVSGLCKKIRYEKLLEVMGFTPEQFLDFCIMCGTDYNPNIPNVGPAKAYKFIKTYGSIENLATKTVLDISILNHIRGRELFTDYKKSDIVVPYCGRPNFDKLEVFFSEKNIKLPLDQLRQSFEQNTIIFVEDNDNTGDDNTAVVDTDVVITVEEIEDDP